MPIRKRFGQNFLHDQAVIDRIFATVGLRPNDRIVEIGPGRGALTQELNEVVSGAIAIELDRELVKRLTARFSNVEIMQADVLDVRADVFDGTRVLGNLPYEISTPLLTKVIGIAGVVDMHFMLQKEVAQRLVAEPGSKEYGRLSVFVQAHAQVTELFDVAPESFHPEPKVQSAFVRIEPKDQLPQQVDRDRFDEILRKAFSQRRKTLKNSLKGLSFDWEQVQVDPNLRADQASLEDYATLAQVKMDRSETAK